MRNLRKIFEAFGLINANPILSIKDAQARMESGDMTQHDRVLLGKILDAVVAIAEEDAVKASKKGG